MAHTHFILCNLYHKRMLDQMAQSSPSKLLGAHMVIDYTHSISPEQRHGFSHIVMCGRAQVHCLSLVFSYVTAEKRFKFIPRAWLTFKPKRSVLNVTSIESKVLGKKLEQAFTFFSAYQLTLFNGARCFRFQDIRLRCDFQVELIDL